MMYFLLLVEWILPIGSKSHYYLNLQTGHWEVSILLKVGCNERPFCLYERGPRACLNDNNIHNCLRVIRLTSFSILARKVIGLVYNCFQSFLFVIYLKYNFLYESVQIMEMCYVAFEARLILVNHNWHCCNSPKTNLLSQLLTIMHS